MQLKIFNTNSITVTRRTIRKLKALVGDLENSQDQCILVEHTPDQNNVDICPLYRKTIADLRKDIILFAIEGFTFAISNELMQTLSYKGLRAIDYTSSRSFHFIKDTE